MDKDINEKLTKSSVRNIRPKKFSVTIFLLVQRLSRDCGRQLKRGCSLLKLDMNHPTRQMNICEYVEHDSSHLSSCIERAFF